MIFYIGRLLLRPVLLHQTSGQGEIRLFCQVDEFEHHKTGFVYLPHHHGITVCLPGDGANHPVPPLTLGHGIQPYQDLSPTTTTAAETESGRGDTDMFIFCGVELVTTRRHFFSLLNEILPGLAGSLPTHVEQKSNALTFAREKAYNFYTIFDRCSNT